MSCQMQPVTPKDPIKIYTASKMRVHVTPKKFTPDLQIFYTFPVFGLNVHVLGVKVPPNAMKRIIFIKLYPTSKRRMLLSENLPQTSRFFTRIYPPYPCHYATLITSSSSVLDITSVQWNALFKNQNKEMFLSRAYITFIYCARCSYCMEERTALRLSEEEDVINYVWHSLYIQVNDLYPIWRR